MIKKVKIKGKMHPVYFGTGALASFNDRFDVDLLSGEDLKFGFSQLLYIIELGLEYGAMRSKTANPFLSEDISFIVDDHPELMTSVMDIFNEQIDLIFNKGETGEKKRGRVAKKA